MTLPQGTSFIRPEPTKSDLLQKYIERSNAGVPFNPQSTVQYNPNAQNTLSKTPTKDVFTQKSQTKKGKIAAIALSSTLALTGLTILGAMGAKGGLFKKARKLASGTARGALDDLANATNNSFLKKLSKRAYKPNDGRSITSAMDNFTNGKDVAARGIFDKIKEKTNGKIDLYTKFDNITSGFYIKKGLQSLKKQYSKVVDLFKQSDDDILRALDELEKSPRAQKSIMYKGKQTKIADILPDIKAKVNQRQQNILSSFGEKQVAGRYKGLNDYLIQDGGGITKKTQRGFLDKLKNREFKDIFTKPVAGDIIAGKKTQHAAQVGSLRSKITNTLNNVLADNKESIASLQNKINPDDVQSLRKLEETVKMIESYSKKSFETAEASRKAQDEIIKKLEGLRTSITRPGAYTSKSPADIHRAINKAQNAIKDVKPGETEELMGLLEEVLEPDTYVRVIKPGMKRSVKALNKVCGVESSDVIDKLRDINCGAAPTDILGIMFSTGALGVYTAMAENKDERISVGLTTGLPILSTIGMCFYGAINQMSAKKMMPMSLGVGFVTKVICDSLNHMYRKHRGLDQNAKTSVVTIDDIFQPQKNKFEEIFFTTGEEETKEESKKK